jgi:hypothetical protein
MFVALSLQEIKRYRAAEPIRLGLLAKTPGDAFGKSSKSMSGNSAR